MLTILQVRLQQYMNRELPDVQAGLEKAKEPGIKLPTSGGSSKKSDTVKGFSIVSEAEVGGFLEFPCFFYDPTDVGTSVSLPFSIPDLHLKFFSSCTAEV